MFGTVSLSEAGLRRGDFVEPALTEHDPATEFVEAKDRGRNRKASTLPLTKFRVNHDPHTTPFAALIGTLLRSRRDGTTAPGRQSLRD